MTNTLKQHRLRAGLTQAELATQAGLSLRTLQHYEQGSKDLDKAAASTVLKLAQILGLSLLSDVEELIGGIELEEAEHKPIIDRATYERVQLALSAKKEQLNEARKKELPRLKMCPPGYKWQDGKLVVDEEEAEVVRRAFDEHIRDGEIHTQTLRELAQLRKKRDEKEEEKSKPSEVYLIYKDSMDDCATIVGYATSPDAADRYCSEHNKGCRYEWEELTWERLEKLGAEEAAEDEETYSTVCPSCGIGIMCLSKVKEHLTNCPQCGAGLNKE